MTSFKGQRYTTDHERFWGKVEMQGGCLVWTSGKIKGYGYFHLRSGQTVQTHRWLYQRLLGPIPADLTLDHLCRNRACCNVLHLEPVTRGENVRRGFHRNAVKTACIAGHPFDEANTYWVPGTGGRMCKACARARANRYYHAKKATA